MWDRSTHKNPEPPAQKTTPRENRYIFNGENRQATVTGYAIRQNRAGTRKRYSTFNIIVGLFAIGTLVVFYINNTIAVNELLGEINTLQGKYQRHLDANATILAEVNQKASLKRIGDIATEQLGMQHARTQPLWFEIPEDLRDRAAEVRKEFPE
jgi:cell division protein FtsL